ncbi:MAG: TRAP transporter fused permease subunit [Treponema sp.]|jgi:TRAP transporter 4TM/12TM fusion protein|nr:TRAP transporter fused permease subunit [Treponema sp.]
MSQTDDDNHVLSEEETEELIEKFDRESRIRHFTGIPGVIIKCLLTLFAAYVFWVTLIGNLPEQVRRCVFLGSLVFIGYLLYPAHKSIIKRVNYIPWYDFILAAAGAACFFYYVFNFQAIINKAVLIGRLDIAVGITGILILAELCRRVVGIPILVVAAGFVTFAFANGYSMRRVVHQLFYTTDGVIGTPIQVCSTFIVIFIFLASFLEKSGIAKFFIDIANSVAGFTSGGPAKVAVIASALEGMISGSSVANTVGSGSVTIPMMKKTGYKPEFAAAVEAAASTGGQIVPPILGAAAFLMAEFTGIPYLVIAASAILPAMLYFTGIFFVVHFEAKKLGLKGLPKESIPRFLPLLLKRGYLFLPIIVLVVLMGIGFTPAYAACYGVLSAFAVSFFRKDTRFSPAGFVEAVTNGSKNTIGVAIACAVAGTIIGIVSLTGIGQLLIGKLTDIVNNPFLVATGTSLLAALIITMLTCLIIGMGIPTTANYVIMATITAPMVMRAGAEIGITVPLLAAHMFVFYFGILADITPPVALAAYAGAAIAKSNPLLTAVTATRLAIAAFIVPFIFVFSPEMLFIGTTPLSFVQIIITSIVGMFNIAIGLEGFMLRKLGAPLRILAVAAGLMLINPDIITDLTGLALSAMVVVIHVITYRKDRHRSPEKA